MSKGNPAHEDFLKRVVAEMKRSKDMSMEVARKKVKSQILLEGTKTKRKPK